MKRSFFIAGNWKMNLTLHEAMSLASDLQNFSSEHAASLDGCCTMAVFPPSLYVNPVGTYLSNTSIIVGAQNCSEHSHGAYTGEVSAYMLASLPVSHVIVGHSERRAMYGDTDDVVAMKVLRAIEAGLVPIICIGETLLQRENGSAKSVLKSQLESAVSQCNSEQKQSIIVAYEPVWAIGSGIAATSDYIAQTHAVIRETLQNAGCDNKEATPILYGGSVTAANAAEIFSVSDVNGALIGGASLRATSFIEIVHHAILATS